MIKILSCDHVKGGKKALMISNLALIGRFWRDGTPSMAVKGLKDNSHPFRITFSTSTVSLLKSRE